MDENHKAAQSWFARELWREATTWNAPMDGSGEHRLFMGNLGNHFQAIALGLDGGVEIDVSPLASIRDFIIDTAIVEGPGYADNPWGKALIRRAGLTILAEQYLNRLQGDAK